MKGILNKVLSAVLNVLTWLIVIFAAIMTIMVFSSQANNGVPNLFGKMPLTIQSDSMKPEFVTGDLILSDKIEKIADLKKGDIISFWTEIQEQRVINTHRINDVKEDGGIYYFETIGDNNGGIADSEIVSQADVIGIYKGTKIPGLGGVMNFLQSPNGFLICIVLPLIVFFLLQLYKFIAAIIAVKQEKAKNELTDEEKKRIAEEFLAQQATEDKKESTD